MLTICRKLPNHQLWKTNMLSPNTLVAIALWLSLISIAMNILLLVLFKASPLMRGPKGERGYTGPQGMAGRDCKCSSKQ